MRRTLTLSFMVSACVAFAEISSLDCLQTGLRGHRDGIVNLVDGVHSHVV